MLRSEFSAGLDRIKIKKVEVGTSFMAYLSKLWHWRMFWPTDETITHLDHGTQSFL